MIETILYQMNTNDLKLRITLVTFVIMANLFISIIESIKLKKFDIKKMPEFIWEWMACSGATVFIEIVISLVYTSDIVRSAMIGVREIMVLSMLGCYLKKILESLKVLGWDVNIDIIINYIDNKKNNI